MLKLQAVSNALVQIVSISLRDSPLLNIYSIDYNHYASQPTTKLQSPVVIRRFFASYLQDWHQSLIEMFYVTVLQQ